MNQVQPEFQKRFSNRVFVALLLTAIAIPVLLLGDWWIIIFSVIGLFFAAHEILTVKRSATYPLPIRIFVYFMMLAMVFYVFVGNNLSNDALDFSQWSFSYGLDALIIPTTLLTILAGTLFFSSITDVRFKVPDATYLITMSVLIALAFQAFLFLRFFPQRVFGEANRSLFAQSSLLLYAGIGTFMTDIGAYLVGTFFGQHKMNVRVSKNKTWEGFFGGVFISFIFSFAFGIGLAALQQPLLPFLALQQWYWIGIISFVMPLIATLGDFTFSLIKREFGIKNFSNMLGEHGGLLDRIDSFSMVCLAVALLISLLFEFFYSLPI